FKDGKYSFTTFPNVQLFDEAGLIGRAFSSSYVPAQGTEAGNAFLEKLKTVFHQHKENGQVKFQYQSEIYLGRL
ncbi:MAG: class I SAM-dependent methyltransferase, partial [Mucilaginibacter sp.]